MRRPSTSLYLNRELGQLEFNRRVLALAADPRVPALERLRYLCIVDSNLDEFFEIRVAGLKAKTESRGAPDTDGMPIRQVFEAVGRKTRELMTLQYEILNTQVLPLLASKGIRILRRTKWNARQKTWLRDYFLRELMPVLTPIGLDPAHPFPRLLNKSLNFVIELEGNDAFGRKSGMAIVEAPRVLPRVIALPRSVASCEYGFVFLSSILMTGNGKVPKDLEEDTELAEEFDLIESNINYLAERNGVDAEVIWEDLESLTDDELYVFAATQPVLEDWQKANKKDKTDGMSQKAVNAYRREHPGSKLKTAVTTKPSKLKKGSKASKRRKSYCSRSRGQMKMHNISCAKTPDKAICKARRRWNC